MLNFTTVSSRNTSQTPREARNAASSPRDRPRTPARYAPVPARNAKAGAQKCVTHRVRNIAGLSCDRSIGSLITLPKKSRVWSIAISTITAPRSRSTASRREEKDEAGFDVAR